MKKTLVEVTVTVEVETSEQIIKEHELVTSKYKLTKKGKEYL